MAFLDGMELNSQIEKGSTCSLGLVEGRLKNEHESLGCLIANVKVRWMRSQVRTARCENDDGTFLSRM